MLDSNKIIGELQVLAQELGDKDSGLVSKAVDLIEYLVENQVLPPDDLRLYVSQLITILGNVSMNLSGGAQKLYPTNSPAPEQVERRSKPRGPACANASQLPPMNRPPLPPH